jgi:hypothetical protein
MENLILQYAAIVLVVIACCISYNIFITPAKLEKILKDRAELCNNSCKDSYTTREEMQIERKELLLEVERRFLEKVAFQEFTKRFDDKFAGLTKTLDKVVENQEHIKDFIIKKGL